MNLSLLLIDAATLLGNDTDADNDDLSIDSVTYLGNGTLTDNGNDTWSYLPDEDFNGIDWEDWAIIGGLSEELAREKRERDRGAHDLGQRHLGAGARAEVQEAVAVHVPDVGVEGDRQGADGDLAQALFVEPADRLGVEQAREASAEGERQLE